MVKIGYIKATKRNQNLHIQKDKLHEFGCDALLVENHEFVNERRVLKKILQTISPGDQLVVADLDVLAVRIDDVLKFMQYIYQQKASIVALSMQTMSASRGEVAKLSNAAIIEFYSYFGQPKKKESNHVTNTGKVLAGRKPKFETNDPLLQKAFAAYQTGEMNESEIERKLGINRQTFRRYRHKFGIERIDKK